MSEFYKFAAEHYVITALLALIIGQTLSDIFRGDRE